MTGSADAAGPDPGDADRRAREVIAAIGTRARDKNLRRVDELEDGLQAVGQGAVGEEARLRLLDVAHQLVGSAGTFGFVRVSEAAREVELMLDRNELGDPEVLRTAGARLQGMRRDLLTDPDLSDGD